MRYDGLLPGDVLYGDAGSTFMLVTKSTYNALNGKSSYLNDSRIGKEQYSFVSPDYHDKVFSIWVRPHQAVYKPNSNIEIIVYIQRISTNELFPINSDGKLREDFNFNE